MLQNLAETHGMEWVIAVPHNIVGPRQKYDDPYRNVASIFINLMLQGRQPYIYGDGNQKRCFSFVSDDIAPLKQMALRPRVRRPDHQHRPRRRVRHHQRARRDDRAKLLAVRAQDHLHAGPPAGSRAGQLLGRQGAHASRLRAQGQARGRHAAR